MSSILKQPRDKCTVRNSNIATSFIVLCFILLLQMCFIGQCVHSSVKEKEKDLCREKLTALFNICYSGNVLITWMNDAYWFVVNNYEKFSLVEWFGAD